MDPTIEVISSALGVIFNSRRSENGTKRKLDSDSTFSITVADSAPSKRNPESFSQTNRELKKIKM